MELKTQNYNINFKGAVLNLNSCSDPHGNLQKLDKYYQSFEENKDEVFLKDKRGNQNVLLIVGDWFISGDTRGYKSNPNATSNDFQIKFFNAFVNKIASLAPKNRTYFYIGNHELDGGEKYFKQIINSINAKVITTNLDFENSYNLKDEIEEGKILKKEEKTLTNKENSVLWLV